MAFYWFSKFKWFRWFLRNQGPKVSVVHSLLPDDVFIPSSRSCRGWLHRCHLSPCVCTHKHVGCEQEGSACHCVIERIVHSVKNHVSNEHLYPRHNVYVESISPCLSLQLGPRPRWSLQQNLNCLSTIIKNFSTCRLHFLCLAVKHTSLFGCHNHNIRPHLGGDCWNYLNERKYKDVDKLEGQMWLLGSP